MNMATDQIFNEDFKIPDRFVGLGNKLIRKKLIKKAFKILKFIKSNWPCW